MGDRVQVCWVRNVWRMVVPNKIKHFVLSGSLPTRLEFGETTRGTLFCLSRR